MPPKKNKKSKNNYSDDEESIEIDNDIDDENILIDENEFEEELEDEELDVSDENDNENENENDNENDCAIEKIIEDDMIYFENDIKKDDIEIILKKEDRISTNRLTKYEMIRILGERTTQLTLGAKPMVKNYETLNYEQIAEEELKLNMIPFKIKRQLPNGKYEIWTLDELDKDHLMSLLD
jgi:DNA-directed RNA polymerase subunit K/omega